MPSRRQATLFVPPPHAAALDALRLRHNPAQHALIRPHVTLLREDEVTDWAAVARALGPVDVTLAFGAPHRDGPLLVLPVVGSTAAFDALRATLLVAPRPHRPHLTLVHPRNGACTDAAFADVCAHYVPFTATFRTVSLIEQVDGGVWSLV